MSCLLDSEVETKVGLERPGFELEELAMMLLPTSVLQLMVVSKLISELVGP